MEYDIIVIGASWGGLGAVSTLLTGLDDAVHQPIVVVQHRAPGSEEGALADLLSRNTQRIVGDPLD